MPLFQVTLALIAEVIISSRFALVHYGKYGINCRLWQGNLKQPERRLKAR
jgi:hypothetical protein